MDGPVSIFDWQRMLFGDESPLFLLEIVLRTSIIYAYTLALLRWLGSRTIGQLSTVEFLLVIALGSAVGDAMFYPDVPLVHALFVVTIVVVSNKLLDILIARFKPAERVIDGVPEEVIREGVLCRPFLSNASMGASELYQELREHGIEHLGQIAHAFIEADGGVTIYRQKDRSRPGLSIVPPWEIEKPIERHSGERLKESSQLACLHCGTIISLEAEEPLGQCSHCDHETWSLAQTGSRFGSEVED